jgi:hypothetical protein
MSETISTSYMYAYVSLGLIRNTTVVANLIELFYIPYVQRQESK